MPIYLVKTEKVLTSENVLVDANNKSAAINHVIRGLVSAAPLSARDVVSHMEAGAKVVKALEPVADKAEPAAE